MATALTIAVAVVVAIPALVGYWRDARRGLLALAGTLLGATLAGFWSARWGEQLAGATGWDARVLTLFCAYAALALGALLVGYGAGDLLPPPLGRQRPAQRLLGVLLGLLNGVLIAGYALRYAAASDAGFAEELAGAPAAQLVHDGLPLLFLGLAVTLAALVLGRGALRMARRAAVRPPLPAPPRPAAPPTTPLPTAPPAHAAKDTQPKR